jgi:hypothetical protein
VLFNHVSPYPVSQDLPFTLVLINLLLLLFPCGFRWLRKCLDSRLGRYLLLRVKRVVIVIFTEQRLAKHHVYVGFVLHLLARSGFVARR